MTVISIHTLRMEGDQVRGHTFDRHWISIHTLRMEGDAEEFQAYVWDEFQSTPSAWRVTRGRPSEDAQDTFQSTPSAWRVTTSSASAPFMMVFQSTPSAWRVT